MHFADVNKFSGEGQAPSRGDLSSEFTNCDADVMGTFDMFEVVTQACDGSCGCQYDFDIGIAFRNGRRDPSVSVGLDADQRGKPGYAATASLFFFNRPSRDGLFYPSEST
ncbi:MAG: hypothetical protein WAV27_11245 [Xanthobacteraceae bacterium]